MQVIESPNDMQAKAIGLRSEGKLIALVPTSGALHDGHRALIKKAQEEADVVVVSTFLNPIEFGANEDYQRFPKDPDRDREMCAEENVHILFRPTEPAMYPVGFSSYVAEETISPLMCGISRPNYFRGVCTLFVKLFNLVRPDSVIMGRRDAQKAAVVGKLIDELHFPIGLTVLETIRDEDGVALNTRLAYLNDFQRKDVQAVYNALLEGKKLVDNGIRNVDRVLAEVTHHITQFRRLRLIYVSAVDPETMKSLRQIQPGNTLIAAAVWCDEVRLIDNILV